MASGAASTPEQVEKYASCTMLAASLHRQSQMTDESIVKCIDFLSDNELIRYFIDIFNWKLYSLMCGNSYLGLDYKKCQIMMTPIARKPDTLLHN